MFMIIFSFFRTKKKDLLDTLEKSVKNHDEHQPILFTLISQNTVVNILCKVVSFFWARPDIQNLKKQDVMSLQQTFVSSKQNKKELLLWLSKLKVRSFFFSSGTSLIKRICLNCHSKNVKVKGGKFCSKKSSMETIFIFFCIVKNTPGKLIFHVFEVSNFFWNFESFFFPNNQHGIYSKFKNETIKSPPPPPNWSLLLFLIEIANLDLKHMKRL